MKFLESLAICILFFGGSLKSTRLGKKEIFERKTKECLTKFLSVPEDELYSKRRNETKILNESPKRSKVLCLRFVHHQTNKDRLLAREQERNA